MMNKLKIIIFKILALLLIIAGVAKPLNYTFNQFIAIFPFPKTGLSLPVSPAPHVYDNIYFFVDPEVTATFHDGRTFTWSADVLKTMLTGPWHLQLARRARIFLYSGQYELAIEFYRSTFCKSKPLGEIQGTESHPQSIEIIQRSYPQIYPPQVFRDVIPCHL